MISILSQAGLGQETKVDSILLDSTLNFTENDTLKSALLQDSTINITTIDTLLDTLKASFWPNIIRSAIIPGLGQIYQEKQGRSVVFYGLAGSFAYNAAYNYYWYDRTNDSKYLNRFRKFTILYGQLYLFNMIDVIKTQLSGKNLVWQGGMFSDKPLKSPWGAVARSAMLPGWGQFYNGQIIKGIITFGLFADFTRKAIVNNLRYMDTDTKEYLERRTINTWYVGLVYMLTMVDAYVDAYLYKFDETMDLTIMVVPMDRSLGINASISF